MASFRPHDDHFTRTCLMDTRIHMADGRTESVVLEERKECWLSNM